VADGLDEESGLRRSMPACMRRAARPLISRSRLQIQADWSGAHTRSTRAARRSRPSSPTPAHGLRPKGPSPGGRSAPRSSRPARRARQGRSGTRLLPPGTGGRKGRAKRRFRCAPGKSWIWTPAGETASRDRRPARLAHPGGARPRRGRRRSRSRTLSPNRPGAGRRRAADGALEEQPPLKYAHVAPTFRTRSGFSNTGR
jgi:hypothetical protein